MTGYATTRTTAAAFVLVGLLVLAAPAVAQTTSGEPRGWERTSVTAGRPDGGRVRQSTTTVPPGPSGWEATSVTTGDSPAIANNDEPASPSPRVSSTTLLYLIGLSAAAIIAVTAARLLRPHGRPRGAV
jgi:hypothetical protein